MADFELDLRGLHCPVPIMRTVNKMNTMARGQTLHVLATDPAAAADFQAYVRGSGNLLLESKQNDKGEFEFLLKRV